MILDFPKDNITTILKRCWKVMSGNRLRYFILNLSFVPMILLSLIFMRYSFIMDYSPYAGIFCEFLSGFNHK